MAIYRLYSLRGTMLVGSEEVPANGDSEAMSIARERTTEGIVVEIWCGARRVRTVTTIRMAEPSRL